MRRQAADSVGPPQLERGHVRNVLLPCKRLRNRRVAAVPTGPQQAPSSSLGAHVQLGGDERCARGVLKWRDQSGGECVRAPSIFDQAIDFPSTDIRVCFTQQDTVFKNWWVVLQIETDTAAVKISPLTCTLG